MILENKLKISDQAELAREEERISKKKAKLLFSSGEIEKLEIGTFKGLSDIHRILFEDIYEFAGKIRSVNIAKDNFRFAPVMYLSTSLDYIDKMPQDTYEEIIEKYVEMNVAHPFREGNGRSMRIWLDLMLKKAEGKVVDWNSIHKADYLSSMKRSPVKSVEIKVLIKEALTNDLSINTFMKGIDASYFYEGYYEFKTEDL
ncbi:MAG: Fic family protein [Defluviitaleaceae bacterium]|nr:Fic family protein [Defluviitaleaceae bacterium]